MKHVNRRQFLLQTTTSALALWLPTSCSSRKPYAEDPNKLGVALLGLGSYSKNRLAPALQMTQHCELRGIITGTPKKIRTWQKEYNIPDRHVYTYDTMHEIANDDAIDVIYVVTPTGTHAQFAIAAAKTGKHVWCEKPMAMTVEECQSIISACAKNKVKLSIGYRLQHEPNTQTLMSYAKHPPFGDMTRIDAQAGYAGGGGNSWRFQRKMGGGALYDMGVYTVNGIRYATDRYPTTVISAKQYTDRPQLFQEVDETTSYVLGFDDGLLAYGKTSVGQSMNQLKVTCGSAWYELSPMQSYTGVAGKRSDGILLDRHITNQQAQQMDNDALAIQQNTPLLVPGEEGLKDMRIIEAIIACAEKKKPVTI